MSAIAPYDWLKQIPPLMGQQDLRPLLGHLPPFPWEKFSEYIAKVFQLEDFEVSQTSVPEWRSDDNLLAGLGEDVIGINLDVMPFKGSLAWLMSKNDISRLMFIVLGQEHSEETIEIDYLKAFYKFFCYEAIESFNNTNFDPQINPKISDKEEIPNGISLTIDIAIKCHEHNFWGRLLINKEFYQNWREKFANRSLAASWPASLAVVLHFEVGKVELTLEEWQAAKIGDFLVLDKCTVNPEGDGRVLITLNNTPYYRAKWKNGNIKIMGFPLYHEFGGEMTENKPKDEEKGEEQFFENEKFIEEEQEEAKWEEDLSENMEGEQQEEWPPLPELGTEHPQKQEEVTPEAKLSTIEEVQLPVVVEIGRIQISVQGLMDLQPGNLLELNIKPEDGVDLVLNGKRIARGELLRIGEMLGVRILDKAS